MTGIALVENLCEMLEIAQGVIKQQAILLMMHGIKTEDGKIEAQRDELASEGL